MAAVLVLLVAELVEFLSFNSLHRASGATHVKTQWAIFASISFNPLIFSDNLVYRKTK
jgi:hypothetical protein